MILFTGQKHSHSNTNNVDGETKRRRHDTLKKYGCVCLYMLSQKKLNVNVIV